MGVAPAAASTIGAACYSSSYCPVNKRHVPSSSMIRHTSSSSPYSTRSHAAPSRFVWERRAVRSHRLRISSRNRRLTLRTTSSSSGGGGGNSSGGPLGGSSGARQLETAATGVVFSAEEVEVEEKSREDGVLPLHPGVVRGELENGLRYVLLSNPVAPQRFEAHLEIHAGSIDEREEEQGLAHLVEHTVFLGSRKRERLLGTGSRSNAYTDFHHTVFHIHAPIESGATKMLPIALEALEEIGFDPAFLQNRIDKERRAVLAEAQMMNTIEYRIDCQLLEHLHAENALGYRFPIGKEELIHKWQRDDVMAFHHRYYYPGNATLYIVGDISTDEAEAEIRRVFSGVSEGPPMAERGRNTRSLQPPVQHLWSAPGLASLNDGSPLRKVSPTPHIFQHPLVEAFQLSIFAKLPVEPVLVESTLRTSLMCRIVLAAFQFRMSALAARYTDSPPPFAAIELDHSDSGREGCAVTTLNIIAAEPGTWREAVIEAVKAVAWLHRGGLTKQEADRYRSALLADSEQLAMQTGQVPHLDNLEFIMESDALGHAVMDQVAAHVALTKVAESVDLESINEVARRLCEFIVEYENYAVEKEERKSTPAALVAAVPSTLPNGNSLDISSEAVAEAIVEGLKAAEQIDASEAGVAADIPEYLMDEGVLLASQPSIETLMAAAMPREEDHKTGIVMMQMANGMKINYRITANEPGGAMIRLVVPGGRARETSPGEVAVAVRALSESGRVGDYSREQVELFCMANLIHCTLEVDDEFVCMDMHLSTGGQFKSPTGEEPKGMTKALQLMHLILSDTKWDDGGLVRAKQFHQAQYRAMERSLEKAAASKVMRRLLGGDFRFQEPSEDQIAGLDLDQCSKSLDAQLIPENMELSMVGDFDPISLRKQIILYMGSFTTRMSRTENKSELAAKSIEFPLILQLDNGGAGGERMHLADSDDRACAFIAGAAPNRWGANDWGWNASETPATNEDEELEIAAEAREIWHQRRKHPLYPSAALSVLAEVINARLFTTVRDSLGLTYDVSFRLNLFDRLCAGWWTLSVTSTPAKIEDAASASRAVLAGVGSQHPTKREVARARRTLIARHESDLKDNAYWIGLLTHLQSDAVPLKDVSAIRDLPALYAAITPEDLIDVYQSLLTAPAQTFGCIAVAGSVKKEGQESLHSI